MQEILNSDIQYLKGVGPNRKLVLNKLGIELTQDKYVKVNNKNQTSNTKIFAGGDIKGEKSTVAWAARSGRDTAENIESFLNNNI